MAGTRSATARGASQLPEFADLPAAVAEIARLRHENAGLLAELTAMKATMETISDGHIKQGEVNRRMESKQASVAAQVHEMEKMVEKLQQAATLAQLSSIPACDRAGPSNAAARAPRQAPAQSQTHPSHQRGPPQHSQQQQQVGTHSFVVYVKKGSTPDTVLQVIAEKLGFNSAMFTVQKIAAGPAATQRAAAEGEVSYEPNDVFIFRTSKFVADKALKGGLRQQLRDDNIPMYVDDNLDREERQLRKARVQEKMDLKATGIKVAWRKATLWKLVVAGDTSTWEMVPAPGGAPAGAAAPAPTQP
jgi:hypothetical protein